MEDIHNYQRTFERTLERINESDKISKENKTWMIGFKDHLLSSGIGVAKINRYLRDLMKFNKMFKSDFGTATKPDIKRVVSEIQQQHLSEETKRCFKIMLRKFYCYVRGFERGVFRPLMQHSICE